MSKTAKIEKGTIFTRQLSVKLTKEELLEKGDEMASVNELIQTETEDQATLKQEMKARISELEGRRNKLSALISRKSELRLVDVEPVLNFEAGMYSETRLDTGEVIFERKLNEEELQVKMRMEAE